MYEITGRIEIKESGIGVPDVVVAACRIAKSTKSTDAQTTASQLLAADRLDSSISDSNGRFVLNVDPVHLVSSGPARFLGPFGRTQIVVAVFAPEEIEDAELPFANEPDLLFASQPISPSGQRRQAMLIRILEAQVESAGLRICPAARPMGCEDLIEEREKRRNRIAEKRIAHQLERREKAGARRQQAEQYVERLKRLPSYLYDRSQEAVIFDKKELSERLPNIQKTVINAGLKRLGGFKRRIALTIPKNLLATLIVENARQQDKSKREHDGSKVESKLDQREAELQKREAEQKRRAAEQEEREWKENEPDGSESEREASIQAEHLEIKIDPQRLANLTMQAVGPGGPHRRRVPPSPTALARLWKKVREDNASLESADAEGLAPNGE